MDLSTIFSAVQFPKRSSGIISLFSIKLGIDAYLTIACLLIIHSVILFVLYRTMEGTPATPSSSTTEPETVIAKSHA
jgi:hypothetical protein